ncbi:MAG: WYL domain-containing protein [Actinomycetota bacterium]|nr:WYL domain-containing protein [Actinomycetota bacterium]
MSRTARLLELLVRVQTKPRFTAAELAEEFGVSRRTMLRDLCALSEMGIPLRSTPGPGGGYSLPRGGRRLSPSLSVDEALALIVSYEALMRYPVSPFSSQSLSAVTKLRAALPPDVVGELDRLRRHVAVVEPVREYEAPLLGELLGAALDGEHLKVTYDSIRSGASERVVYPFGLYASQGFWYCACFDHKRRANVSLRADRFLSAERVKGLERPPHVPLDEWTCALRGRGGERLRLRLHVTERGAKSFELVSLLGHIQFDNQPDGEHGGIAEADIPRSEVGYYASRLLSVGTDVKVESPPELAEALRDKALEIARIYC